MEYSTAVKIIEDIGVNSVYASGEANTKRVLIETVLRNLLGYTGIADIDMEYTADVGIKAGEKVDYALYSNGAVRIIVEAKDIQETLNQEYLTQLYRYYVVSDAEVGIITNGIEWQIYTDSKKSNIMDLEPIYTINLQRFTEDDNNVLACLSKDAYSKERLIRTVQAKTKTAEDAQLQRLREYAVSEELDTYLHSEAFYVAVQQHWHLEHYSIEQVKELVNGVLTGSYVLKYAAEAKYKQQQESGKRLLNLIELNMDARLVVAGTEVAVQYKQARVIVKDIRELPYAVIKLIAGELPNIQFDEIMQKQTTVKRWIAVSTCTSVYDVGKNTVYGYDITNASTPQEAVKRSVQIIKAFKLNPIWFMVETAC